MNNEEFTLQKGDVIEKIGYQWVYDGEPHRIIIGNYSHRSSRTASDDGHTVDLSDFDVWRNGEKVCVEVPVEPELDDEWIECEPSEATMVRIGNGTSEYKVIGVDTDSNNLVRLKNPDGTDHNWTLSKWLAKFLFATFWKKKPAESVVVTVENRELDTFQDGYGSIRIADGIDIDRPFKVTFEQGVVK